MFLLKKRVKIIAAVCLILACLCLTSCIERKILIEPETFCIEREILIEPETSLADTLLTNYLERIKLEILEKVEELNGEWIVDKFLFADRTVDKSVMVNSALIGKEMIIRNSGEITLDGEEFILEWISIIQPHRFWEISNVGGTWISEDTISLGVKAAVFSPEKPYYGFGIMITKAKNTALERLGYGRESDVVILHIGEGYNINLSGYYELKRI